MVLDMSNDINRKYLDHMPQEDFDITTMVATCAKKLISFNNNCQGSRKIDFIGGHQRWINPGSGSLKWGSGGTAPPETIRFFTF